MATCYRCGKTNEEGAAFCNSCGSRMTPSGSAPYVPPGKRRGRLIVLGAFAIVVLLALGYVLLPGISVTRSTSVNIGLGFVFTAEIRNDNAFFERTASVVCEVHTPSGNTYMNSRTVTLGPGESLSQLIITVPVPLSELSADSFTKIYVQ